jgi:hypothetical protein
MAEMPKAGLGQDFLRLLSSLPLLGKPFAAIEGLSQRGQRIVLALILLFFIYPVISFVIVLLLLTLSPQSIKDGFRSFTLSSLGVGEETYRTLDRSNLQIDATVPLSFSVQGIEDGQFSRSREFRQKVSRGQKISFDVYLEREPLGRTDPLCAYAFDVPNMSLGQLSVTMNGSSYQFNRSIDLVFDQMQSNGVIGDREWKFFIDGLNSDQQSEYHQIKVRLLANPDLMKDSFLRCFRVHAIAYMNVFKRRMATVTP